MLQGLLGLIDEKLQLSQTQQAMDCSCAVSKCPEVTQGRCQQVLQQSKQQRSMNGSRNEDISYGSVASYNNSSIWLQVTAEVWERSHLVQPSGAV